MRTRLCAACLLVCAAAVATLPARAAERAFNEGALIIPMDTDFQDEGMFKAFGLLYQLLLADIAVHWVISPAKTAYGTDFVASAVDTSTGEVVTDHAYRGGPFVVAAADAEAALEVVESWQEEHVTVVHQATSQFTGDVNRTLTVAPIIGVFADKNEDIAFGYLNAAAIPDSLGQAWPAEKDKTLEYPGYPDVLSIEEVRGPTDTNNIDGALFDDEGLPVYCELMTMHWGEKERDEGAIAEVREFLYYPTHFFAECQAVNAVENAENGRFLTPNGFIMDDKPDEVDILNPNLPFSQIDGAFQTVGGSEPSYTLPEGDEYYDEGVVMFTEEGTPIGTRDVWMTGYVDGVCDIVFVVKKGPGVGTEECYAGVGKVSYLGGHKYSTDTPVSANPDSQGTRLFLNALFEADCVTTLGQPRPAVGIEGPTWTQAPNVVYSVTVSNTGPGVAYSPALTVNLPVGMSVESSSIQPTESNAGVLKWEMKNLGPSSSVIITLRTTLADKGTYEISGELAYRMGQNPRTVASNVVTTVYSDDPPPPDTDPGGGDADSDVDTDGGDADIDGDADGDGSGNGDGDADGDGSGGGDADVDTDGDGNGGDSSDGGAGSDESGSCGCRAPGSASANDRPTLLITLLNALI